MCPGGLTFFSWGGRGGRSEEVMKLASWLCAIFIEIVFLVYKLAGEIGDLGLDYHF